LPKNPPKQPLPSEKDLGEIEAEIVGRALRESLRRNPPQPAPPHPAEKPTSQ
jgi:hypothetical protein